MLKGFREFISRGSVVDLAVGVVIGAAFTKIVDALTKGIIDPLIAAVVGSPNLDSFATFHIGWGVKPATISFGVVLTAIIQFLLISAALYFIVILPMNKLAALKSRSIEKKEEIPAPSEETQLLVEIRDLLAKRS